MTSRRLGALLLPLWLLPLHPQPQDAARLPRPLTAAADSFLAISASRDGDNRWTDLSDASRERDRRRVDAVGTMLRAIPATQLLAPEATLLSDNLRETIDASVGSRVCRNHLWSGTSQFRGWHVSASNAARVQPVGSPEARERALARFRALPKQMESERALLSRGLDSGYTASGDVIRTVVRQFDDLLPEDLTRSPLFGPALRDSTPEFHTAWRELLTGVVYPAARTYREFLIRDYLPRARREGSLAHQRDGSACYAAGLRAQTSVASNLDSLMGAARADLDRVAAQLVPLVRQLTGTSGLSDGVRQLRSDPRFTFSSRDSILPAYRAMTAKAAGLIGRVVAGFGPESLVVAPYPEFQEKAGLPPQYLRASGGRPAQFLVNLSRTEVMSVANAVAHEAYPGHHLQRIAEARAEVIHPVMRTLFVGGFIEGWGIYSERLAEEMGLYETPLDRAGYLVHLLDVMVAAYLDIGYHTRGWSRQDLVDSMMVLGGRTQRSAEAYADRHAATPGQLATYYVGYQTIQGLRENATRRLGSAFRSPEFHREVLRDGTITLASLDAKVARWMGAAPAPDTLRRSADWLGLLPDGDEKRRFILDCTGCHQLDDQIVRPGGQIRPEADFMAAVSRMLGFAGASTGFPVINHERDAASTARWLARYLARDPVPRPRPAMPTGATITEYLMPEAGDLPHDVAVDGSGTVIVTGMFSHRMWLLDPATGRFTGVDIPVPKANPRAIELDAAGNWWVVLGARHQVARYSPKTGTWKTWPAGFYPHSLALAPDGGVWVNGHFTRQPELIARLDPAADSANALTTVEIPPHPGLASTPGGPIPYEIRIAPDGRVWGSELQGNRLFAYDPVGRRVEVFTMPGQWSGPRRFDIDPNGKLWIPAYASNELVRLDPVTRRFQRFPLPVPDAVPYVVRVDQATGRVWIGTAAADAVLAFEPATRRFTTYPLPSRGALIRHLALDPRTRDLWIAYGASPGRIPARIARLRVR